MSKTTVAATTVAALPEFSAEELASHVPSNKQVAERLADGFTISDFRTLSLFEGNEKAAELRAQGYQASRLNLLGGFFTVCFREAPASEAKAASAKVAKPIVPVTFEGREFESTKEARAFAQRLLDACRAAEFEADRAAALAAKSAE